MLLCNNWFYASAEVELIFTGQALTNVTNTEICAQVLLAA